MSSWTSCASIALVLGSLTVGSQASAQDRNAAAQQVIDREPTSETNAASPDRDQVLISGKLDHGGYGAPHLKVTTVAGHAGLLMGGEGAWIIGHSFLLGGGGYGLVTNTDAPDLARSPLGTSSLGFGYGGVRVGYIIAPHDLFHVVASVLVGAGSVQIIEHLDSDTRTYRSASMFALEPDVALEVNIAHWIRAGIDGSYRYMPGSGIPGLSASKMGGPAAGVLVAFGWF